MQPKKQPGARSAPPSAKPDKCPEPRRPAGIQALGPVRYEQLRRALHQLNVAAGR
jgi:hypothetical protein